MIILYLLIAILGIILGGLIASIIIIRTECVGNIIMDDDLMYLAANAKSLEKYKDGALVLMQIKRRNFKGFNE